MLARAPQLFRVTFTHIDRFTAALLPANYDCGSEVAVESVMRRKGLRRLSSLEPPLSAAGAITLRHTSIIVNP